MNMSNIVTIFLWCEFFSGHFEWPWPEHWKVPWRRQPQDCHHVFRKCRPELWTRARKPWVQVNLLLNNIRCAFLQVPLIKHKRKLKEKHTSIRYYREKKRTSLGVPAGRRGSRTPSKLTDVNLLKFCARQNTLLYYDLKPVHTAWNVSKSFMRPIDFPGSTYGTSC